MNRIFLVFAAFFFFPSTTLADVDCSIAEDAVRDASAIRQLVLKKDVECRLQDRASVEAYLRSAIERDVPKERLENEEEMFKRLGFIPEQFEYVTELVKLYTDQLGGYYEPREEYYAMASWIPEIMQHPIAVHELTHALQDQHFALEKFVDQKKLTSDELLARSALIEGDAMAVMTDYSRNLRGQGSIADEPNISLFMLQSISGSLFSESIRETPSSLRSLMLFPYISGLQFAHSILRENGYQGLTDAFKKPPSSTREILHPDVYPSSNSNEQQRAYDISMKNFAGRAVVHKDVLGEFFVSALLSNFLFPQEASDAASGWRGDQAVLFKNGDGDLTLSWVLVAASKEDAKNIFNAFSESYKKRFKNIGSQTATEVVFSGDSNYRARITLEGELLHLEVS